MIEAFQKTIWFQQNFKCFSTSVIHLKVLKNAAKFKKSSQDWLTRQLNDPYVRLAKIHQYRARSAFKLIEIDDQHHFLKPGTVVIECGSAPGAWTQVITSRVHSEKEKGFVIANDLTFFAPVKGSISLCGLDFRKKETQLRMLNLLENRKIDVVLSDMAPNATGIKSMDQERVMELAYECFRFALPHLKKGGTFMCKIWDGPRKKQFMKDLTNYYESVRSVKPPASRSDSSESFILALKYRGVDGR